jgi:hypothetical protein
MKKLLAVFFILASVARAQTGNGQIVGTGTILVVPYPTVSVIPPSLAFGSVQQGISSSSQAITIQNTDTTPLSILSIVSSATSYTFTTNCPVYPSTLNSSASCTVNVTFTPAGLGSIPGTITVTDNAQSSPQLVTLSGTGVAGAPIASVSPSSLNFGNQIVNSSSAQQTVTLENTGNSALIISSIVTSPSQFTQTNNCPASLGVLASCTINVTFTPNSVATFNGTLSISDNASGSPQVVTLTGVGVSAGGGGFATLVLCPNAGEIGNNADCVSSPALTFGKQGVGTASMPLTVSVNNCAPVQMNGVNQIAACTGSGNLSLNASGAISITGSTDFAVTGGTCGNGSVIASGGSCTVIVTFSPTSSSGTNENATLTIGSNAVNGASQTVALSGASATVTPLSACGALSANVNYQLTANVSAATSCFTAASGADLNLNGFTVTYCGTASSSMAQGVTLPNGIGLVTVHNGTITESGTNTCTGLTPSGLYGSSDVGATNDNNSGLSASLFNLTLSQNDARGKAYYGENGGASSNPAATIHDVIITDKDPGPGSCNSIGCRAEDQYYTVIVDQGYNRTTGIGDSFYNNAVTGGAQGTWQSAAPDSNCSNNLINLGNLNANGSAANGFACQMWGSHTTVANNLIIGSGTSGSITSGRGIQISSANTVIQGGVTKNNTIIAFISNNDPEYACAGVEYGSTYGMQMNTAGDGHDLSGQVIENNNVEAVASPCGGYAFSQSSATIATGINTSKNNSWICRGAPGYVQTANVNCAAMRFDANQYPASECGGANNCGYGVESFTSVADYFSGDSADIYIWYDGNAVWRCAQCIFNKPTTAIAGWHFLDDYNGGGSGGSSGPFYFIDPTFSGGAAITSNNLATWAPNNTSFTFSYYEQWTITVTVKGAVSGNPISGATVTFTDSASTVEATGTTNSSGQFVAILNDTQYKAASGSYTTPTFNPFTLAVTGPSGAGCSAFSNSETYHTTTAQSVSLGGC